MKKGETTAQLHRRMIFISKCIANSLQDGEMDGRDGWKGKERERGGIWGS